MYINLSIENGRGGMGLAGQTKPILVLAIDHVIIICYDYGKRSLPIPILSSKCVRSRRIIVGVDKQEPNMATQREQKVRRLLLHAGVLCLACGLAMVFWMSVRDSQMRYVSR